jgi:predicted transcriptional regulator
MNESTLANVNKVLRKLIQEHMLKNGLSLNSFAKRAGVQQNGLWKFMHQTDPKSINSNTIEKIGKYLEENQ